MYVKIFASILDSSVWDEDHATVRLWVTILAMADEHGIVRASVGGLAKRARIERAECEAGLAKFMAPDPDSRTEAHEGRRIEKVDGGWLVLNHAHYREIRTGRQRADAERQARHREKLKAESTDRSRDDDVTAVTVTDVTTIASASASVSEPVIDKKPLVKEAGAPPDPLVAILVEADLLKHMTEFTSADDALIRGFLRGQRSPLAVALTLRSHLVDEEVPPAALALAVREYMTLKGNNGVESRYFGGFVKRAVGHLAQKPMRAAARQEERFISKEDHEAERSRREEAEITELLRDFERTHGEEYLTLQVKANSMVDAKFRGAFRQPLIRAALVKLIRERGA